VSDEEQFLKERKTTTITKTGLSVELTRTSKGVYKWVIQVDLPNLDEAELLRRLERVDRELRKKFLGERVEEKRKEVVEEEKPLKTIPLQVKWRGKKPKLLGRIAIYEDKISLEPINPLPIKDGAIGWLIGFVEGKFGKDRLDVEKTVSGERFSKIIIHAKLSDKDLYDLRRKASWSFEKASSREAERL